MDVGKRPFHRIKLMVTIVDRGLGDEVVETCRENGTTFNMLTVGYGAAGMDLMDYLGLTDTENDIVFSVVRHDRCEDVLNMIKFKFDLDEPGNGLAFAIPISGVSGPLALRYMAGRPDHIQRRKDND